MQGSAQSLASLALMGIELDSKQRTAQETAVPGEAVEEEEVPDAVL